MPKIYKGLYSKIVQQIVRYINEEEGGDHIPQPMFIVGRRGSGKTTILRNLMDALECRGLLDRLQFFGGKQFFISQDIIQAIEGMEYAGNWGVANDNDEERRIVIIDDFDYFLKRSSFEDQYKLRNYLNRESSPLLIATISEIDVSLADYRAPFFEGVRLIYIPPLNNSIIATMDIPTEKQNRIYALMEYLPPVIHSLKLASDIIALSDSKDSDMQELLNFVAPSYRVKFEGMPVYSQKMLYAMSMKKTDVTLAELRDLTGLSGGTLSTYLRQMIKSGDIRKTMSKKRDTPYAISDSLFKLWLSSSTLF